MCEAILVRGLRDRLQSLRMPQLASVDLIYALLAVESISSRMYMKHPKGEGHLYRRERCRTPQWWREERSNFDFLGQDVGR